MPETPAIPSAPAKPARSLAGALSFLIVAGGGLGFGLHQYGSVAGMRQRLAGHLVVIANPTCDVGVLKVGGPAGDFAFRVRNCSSRPLMLLGLRTSCGCVTTGPLPLVVEPGTWGLVTGKLVATVQNFQARGLELYTDEPTAGIVPCMVTTVGLKNSE